MRSDGPSTRAAHSRPDSHSTGAATISLLLASGIVCLLPQPITLAAEFEPLCPNEEWETYDEDDGLEVRVVGITARNQWKQAGKPVFDRRTVPSRYAVLLGPQGMYHTRCGIWLRYIDGQRVKGNGDFKLTPGEHTLVFGLLIGNMSGGSLREFKVTMEEGMEYRIQALLLQRVIKSSHWIPIMEYRELQDYAPKSTAGD